MRRAEPRAAGGAKGPIRAEEPAFDDVVDVIDTVNIAAPADACEGRSWTSLTPRLGVDLSSLMPRVRLCRVWGEVRVFRLQIGQ
jgi:hypothetical protein